MKRLVVLVVCVGTLAFLPWALAATGNRDHARNQDQSAPPAADNPTVTGQLAARHSHQASVDLHALRDGSGERWTHLLPKIENERWREFLVDPNARVRDYRERPELRDVELEARRPIPKRPTDSFREMPNDATGVLIVKFRDDVRARLAQEERMISRAGRNMQPIERLIDRLGLSVEPAFYDTEEDLAKLQARAAEYSGREQPDLAGMIHLTGPADALVRAAQQLNENHLVEFVEFEREYYVHYAPMAGEGACCFDDAPCVIVVQEVCDQIGGAWQGRDTTCDDCGDNGACCIELPDGTFGCVTTDTPEDCLANFEGFFQGFGTVCFGEDDDGNTDFDDPIACSDFEPACGARGTGNCLEIGDTPHCDFEECCETVCEQDPFCCGELDPENVPGNRGPQRWDVWCRQLASEFCGGDFAPPGEFPACFGNSNPCFEPHSQVGCAVSSCCNAVCQAMPSCCGVAWTSDCAILAENICSLAEDPGATPNFVHLQGYLTPGGYVDELGAIPPEYAFLPTYESAAGIRPIPGYGGEGYDLPTFENLAQLLWDEYGIGHNPDMPDQPTARGETIRVGVIEHSAFVQPFDPETNNHEALKHVISEPGQTVLQIPGSENLTGNHGTACLGIVNGVGTIEGVAPDILELHFFPIVSAEEGGRFGRAMASAMQAFGPGDVLSFSIGPGGPNTLASSARSWMLLNMATDVGITCVISAGNDCENLDGSAQFMADSDVIIVGAVYPGREEWNPLVPGSQGGNVHCRLPFSNFCQGCDATGAVHAGGWGIMVTTAGYGDLFFGEADNPNLRSYTTTFSGTSAAAPQVAGVAARLQSFAKQFYGIPLTPAQIRGLISGNGITQCGAPPDRPDLVPGHATDPCVGSWSQEEDSDNIGVVVDPDAPTPGTPVAFTMLFPAAETMISTEFFDCSPFHQEIHTIRGELQSGNIFSVCGGTPPVPCAADGNFYIAESQPTNQNSSPVNVPEEWASALNNVTYNVSGHVADVLLVGKAPQDTVLDLGIGVVAQGPLGVAQSIIFVQVYDWTINHWMYVGSAVTGPGILTGIVSDAGLMTSPQRFVNDDDQTILVRVWAFGFNTPSGPGDTQQNNFQFPIDCINLTVGTPSFGPSPLD